MIGKTKSSTLKNQIDQPNSANDRPTNANNELKSQNKDELTKQAYFNIEIE